MEIKLRTRLFSLFLNLMMFFTFNMANLSGAYAQSGETETYANVDTVAGCEDTDPSATGGAYIYKPGCKFNEEKTTTQTWTPKTINKILMGLMAVVAIASAKFDYVPNRAAVMAECPQNNAASISLPAITIGGIAYVAGEIQANIRYKSAAKKATDITFSGVKTEDNVENNKQLEAFDNLIEIYEQQIGAAKTKKALTTVAEIGYAGAAGVELANILSCRATCKANWAKLNQQLMTPQTTINLCPGAGAAFNAMLKANNGTTISSNLGFKAQGLQTTAKFGSTAKSFFGVLSGGGDLPEFGSFDLPNESLFSLRNDASRTRMTTSISTGTTSLTAAGSTPYTVSLCQSAANSAVFLNSIVNLQPLQCCGSGNSSGLTSFSMNPKGDYFLPDKTDVEFKNILGKAGNLIEGKIIKNDSQRKMDEMTTLVAYNAIFENEVEKILSGNESKEVKLQKISVFSKKLERTFDYLNKNIDGFAYPADEKLELKLANSLMHGEMQKVSQILNEFANSFKISNAQAKIGFMEVLNFAGPILMLRAALKKIYTKYAGTSPKRRAIYFTILAGIGGYTLSQDAKTLKELKKRKEIIEDERKKFANAASSNSLVTEGDGQNNSLNLKSTNYAVGSRGLGNYPGCIAATGGSYGPVKCPSLIKRDSMSIPKMNDKTRNLLTGAHVDALGTLQDVGYNAASGAYLDNPNLLSGALASASSNSNAMRAYNQKLREKIDEVEKDSEVKDSKGNIAKPFSLASFHEKMMSTLGGGTLPSMTPAELAGTDDEEKAIDENSEKVEAFSKSAPSQVGVGGADFSIDLGLNESQSEVTSAPNSEEQKLEDFVVEQNDINKKTEVSIFKILSNRYLLSYPKVLEEKK